MQAVRPKQLRNYGSIGQASATIDLTTLNFPLTSNCITCKACRSFIDLIGKRHQFVVKCEECGEATAIRKAPKGKRYIRCNCKCLLVVPENAQQVSCPRPNCKRNITPIIPLASKTSVFTCPYCCQPFWFDHPDSSFKESNLVKCPRYYCMQISLIGGRSLPRKWAMLFWMLSIAFFAAFIALVCTTTEAGEPFNGAMYIAYIGILTFGLLCFLRGYHFWAIKICLVESPA